MMILSQYHIFELDTINIYSVVVNEIDYYRYNLILAAAWLSLFVVSLTVNSALGGIPLSSAKKFFFSYFVLLAFFNLLGLFLIVESSPGVEDPDSQET
jgi:hypothetical protein